MTLHYITFHYMTFNALDTLQYIHTYMHAYIPTHIHYIHTYITYINKYIHTSIHALHKCIHTYIHYIHDTNTYIYTYRRIYIEKHAYLNS